MKARFASARGAMWYLGYLQSYGYAFATMRPKVKNGRPFYEVDSGLVRMMVW